LRPRVENGSRGEVTRIGRDGTVTLTLDGSEREITLTGKDIDSLRLAYAQPVYRQQGATVERSVVLTGGWQTSKESAYVQATRARHGTDWYLARDQLGEEGQDPDRIVRLANRMSDSRAHRPSIAYRETTDLARDPTVDPLRTNDLASQLTQSDQRQEPDLSDLEIDLGR
jgi:ATP-dependent exoDNAse (exonuclease V) alpha subunit